MTKGIDCSTPLNASTAKALAQQGFQFVGRYLVPENYRWKRLTLAEANVITEAGMQVISVFETTANRASGGTEAGKADGAAALKEAKLLGQPTGSTIYFAVDYDAQPKDYDNIERYLKAATEQIPGYCSGVYGSYAVIEEMAKRKACTSFWQTYAWSSGKKSGNANVYQYKNDVVIGGISVDLNESYGSEGWWNTKGEVVTTMSQDDAVKIIRFLSAAWFASINIEDKNEFNRLANEVRKSAGIPIESSSK
ncbi:DUF1906 domain-containing protein [Cohnella abietis]|uniref:Rv2525c-like glycoside hydrolase-like domain-containing protein n=1 Tax=Cohnella abietis TaxID=2507935 RepID=A0A3T1D043_9BACL|nr:DUF1906 domain-containing protein [Cohnella abietis]BBI31466.1 hypothetical protein KCTCHS21_08650 [Cohnella abietis]